MSTGWMKVCEGADTPEETKLLLYFKTPLFNPEIK
jgi:hypothetical protein